MNIKKRSLLVAMATMGMILGSIPSAFAATISQSATSVTSDSVSGNSVALPAITVTETAAGDIPAGTFTLALPSGYAFDTASVANVNVSGLNASSTVAFPDAAHVAITVTGTSTTAGSLTIGSSTPLKVKATSGTPLASTGTLALSAGTITGITATSSFGSLSQIPGAASKLVFSTQPPTTATTSTSFGPVTVATQDQFGNPVTSDSGRTVSLSISAINPTSTTGSLGGSTSATTNSGLAQFNTLNFSQPGTIALVASSTGLLTATSNSIVISNAPTTTPTPTPTTTPSTSCNLQNGMLVRVGNSSTVYMVVNCVLRPFTSAAIFHARGKKFQDIRDIKDGDEHHFSIGRPVGQGNDDDTTVVTPPVTFPVPVSTSTVPSLSSLPEGSIVQVPGNPTVYLVSGGVLKPVTSMQVLNSYKKDLKHLKQISAADLASMQLGSPATFADGTLLKGSNNTIYVVRNGQLFGIPNMKTMSKHGWSAKNVIKVSDGDLRLHQIGGMQD